MDLMVLPLMLFLSTTPQVVDCYALISLVADSSAD